MASLSDRVIHHVNHVPSLKEVSEEISVVNSYLNWIKAAEFFRKGNLSFWVTPEGRTLELEISPREDGWQIILLE